MIAYYAKLYFLTLVAFLVIDGLWLGLVARGFYGKYLGFLLKANPNWAAAAAFYLLFVAGVALFVVVPGLQHGSAGRVLVYGAFFGLVTYATYDLTNLATIDGWPPIVSLVDLVWGTGIGAAVSYIGFLLGRWLQ
jgi:uncharacterized membrane protein